MVFCPVQPQNGARGPGDPPHIPKPKVSGLAAEPSEGVAGSGAGGGPRGGGGQHPQCGSSQRHEPGCGGSAEGQAQPRGRRGPGLPQWPWAEAGGQSFGGGGDHPQKLPTPPTPHPKAGGMRHPQTLGRGGGGGAVNGEGPNPAWRGAGATRAGRRRGLGEAVAFKVTPRMAEGSASPDVSPPPTPGTGVPKPPWHRGGVPPGYKKPAGFTAPEPGPQPSRAGVQIKLLKPIAALPCSSLGLRPK
ncbi:translation initiation factor IF-2-like [Aquila chrysaetos chrysaetos]|uniref:translation initiation factor IF-2-like n=1 Tax=Aquila chrysaetos chrysaetos TaxID=223781 RepID=UPI00117711B1|nr:translation initiation factor IF-2-like [Aquila chrysaetos chrysaetos]